MPLIRLTGTKNLAHLRHAAARRLDAQADAVRSRFRTPGKDAVYIEKRTEARDYLRDAARGAPPDLAGFPYLAAEAGAGAPDAAALQARAAALAALWIAKDAEWRVAGPAVEAAVVQAKAAVRASGSKAAVDAAAEAGIAALDAIGEAPPPPPAKPRGPIR